MVISISLGPREPDRGSPGEVVAAAAGSVDRAVGLVESVAPHKLERVFPNAFRALRVAGFAEAGPDHVVDHGPDRAAPIEDHLEPGIYRIKAGHHELDHCP